MSISSVGGASSLSQLYTAQQAQAAFAVGVDPAADDGSDACSSSAAASAGNSLTGTGSSNLDSQTLQALLDLTQQDATAASSQGGASGQAPGQNQAQVQGGHHHHHRHGGAAAASASGPAPDQTAADSTGAGSTDADSTAPSPPVSLAA